MTERLADINARIASVRQIGAIVNAMRGIAAARAHQARSQLEAVDSYAATIAQSIGRALSLTTPADRRRGATKARPALVLFCAEQGFAGAFSERMLDAVRADLGAVELFLIGTRGVATAAERGAVVAWKTAAPSHSLGVPKLADRIAQALYARIAAGEIDRLDAVFGRWTPGAGAQVERRRLFPLDFATFSQPTSGNPPLVQLPPDVLLGDLASTYLHAQLCHAALHAFAAENEARMEAMAAARSQIERRLLALQATQRQVRQEEITAEIIELAAGERAAQAQRRGSM